MKRIAWVALPFAVIAMLAVAWVFWPSAHFATHTARCALIGGDARHDLALLCGAFEANERDLGGRACNERQAASISRFEALRTELCTPDVISIWQAIGNVPPGDKYGLMKRGAGEAGVADWTCAAMERCFASIEAPKCKPTGAECGNDDWCCFGACDGGSCTCLALRETCREANDCCGGLRCSKRDSAEYKCRGDREAPCLADDDCAVPLTCEPTTHRCDSH